MGALDGKKALVTGGSRGIGRAIVHRLARDGASVVFSYLTNTPAAEEVVKSACGSPGQVQSFQADQGQRDDIELLFEETDRRLNGLDILVINAATFGQAGIVDVKKSDFNRVMAVNIEGPFIALQLAGRIMRDNGRIINISTITTTRSSPNWGLYTASKAFCEQIMSVAAQEFGHRDITVNSVSPGPTETDALYEEQEPKTINSFVGATALRRLGRPSDIANVVAYLAGSDAQWITGQNIRATGGLL
ncbi:SDR family oxidoreductase [Actinoallomurus purpureus]|uniref:SDR family oxidoreductase n=1 Tax=Actinoallomurus purpureus TaxID=478114 RepID=UPI002092EA70|nr:SDR family oxidoreductase [Actinoallomurus purpureus]MCO6010975.1 SDR family oxidoreductase [Actinoallomurus purpureus]